MVAVQVAHFLLQLQTAPLFLFHPHSFLSHLPPPELLAILPEAKVNSSSKFSTAPKHKTTELSSSFGWTLNTENLNISYLRHFCIYFKEIASINSTCIHNEKPDTKNQTAAQGSPHKTVVKDLKLEEYFQNIIKTYETSENHPLTLDVKNAA